EAGRTVVVEEFMEGEEASFFVLSDGAAALALAPAQDHKTVFDDDRGPNTGGMGAYSPAPVLDPSIEARVMAEIVRPTIEAMAKEDCPYQGVLYVGLMITATGPRVVEFNCRFGDPECQVILPRLDQALLPLLDAGAARRRLPGAAAGRGLRDAVAWRRQSPCGVLAASGGCPGSYETGLPIAGIEAAGGLPGVTVFHAGTALCDGRLATAAGRVLGVEALGDDVETA